MNPKPATYLEINLQAIRHNYKLLRGKLQPNTRFLAVIKAFSYGHEDVVIARMLEKEGVDYFGVAYLEEGIRLRNAGISTPILVLHPQGLHPELYVDYHLEPNIYSQKILEKFTSYFAKNQSSVPVHLKFNTGLNRLGFNKSDIPGILSILKENRIEIASVFSHLVASEDPDERDFSLKQIEQFESITGKIKSIYEGDFIKHLCNTSGVYNYPQAHYDMVRIGIGLYGYANNPTYTKELRNAGKLVSRISQIHTLSTGESVGYNRGFIAKRKTRSATLPIGHADGIPRSWGKGKGYVTIGGQKAPILGNVCMDMIMVDVTNVPCNEGDEVIIFDNQQTVEDLAQKTGTISYEIITGITRRVKRIPVNVNSD